MDGIREQLDPGEPLNRNLYELSAAEIAAIGLDQLPPSLAESLACLNVSGVLREALGDALIDEFLTVKRRELRQFQSAVTDWERDRYLAFY